MIEVNECGIGNAEKDMLEWLIFIISAFRIPNSEFERPTTHFD